MRRAFIRLLRSHVLLTREKAIVVLCALLAVVPARAGTIFINPYAFPGLAFGGSLGSTSSGSSVTSLAHAISGAVPAGSVVLVSATHKAGDTAPTCTDARGNTYTLAIANSDGSRTAAIFHSQITTPLQAGDNVTVTWGASAPGNITQVYYATGNFGDTVKTGSADVGGAQPSVSVTDALGVMVGVGIVNNNGETYTPDTGWTEDADVNGIGASVTTNHRDTNANGTDTWDPTRSAGSSGAFAAASFF
jgi:hypothetical protein